MAVKLGHGMGAGHERGLRGEDKGDKMEAQIVFLSADARG